MRFPDQLLQGDTHSSSLPPPPPGRCRGCPEKCGACSSCRATASSVPGGTAGGDGGLGTAGEGGTGVPGDKSGEAARRRRWVLPPPTVWQVTKRWHPG